MCRGIRVGGVRHDGVVEGVGGGGFAPAPDAVEDYGH